MGTKRAALIGGGACAVALVVGLVYAGSHVSFGCPAIGYAPSVHVELRGAASAVDGMSFCVDVVCSPEPEPTAVADPDSAAAEPAIDPVVASKRGSAIKRAGYWELNPGRQQGANPKAITVTAYSNGDPLVTRSYDLAWRRAEPGNACNLGTMTDPVVLLVPAR